MVKEQKEPAGLAGQQDRLAMSWLVLSKSEALIPSTWHSGETDLQAVVEKISIVYKEKWFCNESS